MQNENLQMKAYGKRHCPTCEEYGPLEGGAIVDQRTGRWECKACITGTPESRKKTRNLEWSLYVPKQKAPRNRAFDTLSALWSGQRDGGGRTQQPIERRERARSKSA